MHNFNYGQKQSKKCGIFMNINNHPLGENSPNLVTLVSSKGKMSQYVKAEALTSVLCYRFCYRVIKLGEFSPIGQFFMYMLWAVFLKIEEVAQNIGLFFPLRKIWTYYFGKNEFGYILGDFLTTHLVTLFVQHSRVQIN
jgi:hypothetical protein